MLICFFAIPVLLYGLFAFSVYWTGFPRSHHTPLVTALITVLLTLIGFLYLAPRPGPWRSNTQVAWSGVESRAKDQSLVIGGARSGATIGWPSGRFSPELFIRPGNGRLALEIARGGGFIHSEYGYLNGTAFDRSIAKGNFTIEDERTQGGHHSLHIRHADGQEMTAKPYRIAGRQD